MEAAQMIQGLHGGDVLRIASELQCEPSEIIDFSANINPRGLPASALDPLLRAAECPKELLGYPDWVSHPLRRTLANRLNVPIESVVLGAGASALITDAIRAARPSNCIAFLPAFAEYRRACDACDALFTGIQLKTEDHFQIDTTKCVKALRTLRPELLILNNPHNPSGSVTSKTEIRAIIDEATETGTAVLVDEAFIDYVPENQITADAATRRGLIAVRSLTKFYGCPGLRVGYAVAHPSFAREIEQQMPAWPIGSLALEVLNTAVQDLEYARITIEENARERALLRFRLAELGFETFPPGANFLLMKLPAKWADAARVREELLRRHRILVRDCRSFEGLEEGRYIRLAVLGANENQLLINAFVELGGCLK
jgi:threonine-phosphate decarboxylase